jgi:ABC-type uncharacterized transport system involved in gliding motility auxiliary subunit
MAGNDHGGDRTRQQILTGTNFAVYTLIVIAFIVLVNWFASNHEKRWDMTPNKKYSLSEQTHKILKDLSKDVTIYAFDRERNFGAERDVLGMYQAASNRVTVKYIDPNRQPALTREFDVRTAGTIVVAAGDRHMEAQGNEEGGITNALVGVLKGQRTACFIETHGERKLDSSERDGYDHFKKELTNENYQTQSLPFLQKIDIPQDCTMIVIAGPQNDYLPPEVDAIEKYVQGGGRALIMLDAGVDIPNLTKMMGDLGVTVRNDLVIDENPVAQMFGTEPYMPLIIKYGNNPIVEPLNDHATLFPLSRSFQVGADSKPGTTVTSLGDTSADNSYGVTDWNPKIKEIKFDAKKDVKGPLSVAVAGSISGSGDKKTEARFVATGTSLIAANSFLGFQSNRDFMMNSINWLSADEDLISVRATPPETQHLSMNASQMNRLLVFGVFGVPLIIIFAGVMVWWQRR